MFGFDLAPHRQNENAGREFTITTPLRVGVVIDGLAKSLEGTNANTITLNYLGTMLRLGVSETQDSFTFDNDHDENARIMVEVVVDKHGRVLDVSGPPIH